MGASKRLRTVALAVGLVLLASAPAGADASHLWAVGRVVNFNVNPATYRSLILRWDGNTWGLAAHPRFARNHALRGVAAPAANDAWAVGTRQVASGGLVTLVEHWDGTSWSTVASPNPNPTA